MGYFDDENNIIDFFRKLQNIETSPIGEKSVEVLNSILLDENWSKWKDSSGKADLPPDFYSDDFKLMMDVMRIDDHGHKNKKGKIVNHTYAKESQMEKELKESGLLDKMPNAKIVTIGQTNLPTQMDHNYIWYQKNFKEVISNHIKKISNYKQNHPNHKVIFFLCDESSAYGQAEEDISKINFSNSSVLKAKPHVGFIDKAFLDVIRNSEIDYFIWFTPFKKYGTFTKEARLPELPKAVILNVSDLVTDYVDLEYSPRKMFSLEE